ncbi:MAG: hypothetical protein M3301_00660 [Chloroflexota bacterium]|nr:hypothetical protein [Chloroflexota bacterium]
MVESSQESTPSHTERQEPEFGEGKGPAESETPGEPDALPDLGGYEGRDPKTDMPRIPTVPETQDDPRSHDAAPDPESSEPPASHEGGNPGSG